MNVYCDTTWRYCPPHRFKIMFPNFGIYRNESETIKFDLASAGQVYMFTEPQGWATLSNKEYEDIRLMIDYVL